MYWPASRDAWTFISTFSSFIKFKLFISNTFSSTKFAQYNPSFSFEVYASVSIWLFFYITLFALHNNLKKVTYANPKLTFSPACPPISINQSGALPFKHSSARLHLHGPCGLGRWGLSEVIAGNWWMQKCAWACVSVREPIRHAILTCRTEVMWRRQYPLNGNFDICHESIKGIQTNGSRLPREPVFLRQTLVTA